MPGADALAGMARLCEDRYERLTEAGCDPLVAADRTYDALRAALGEVPACFDGRDRLFENELRGIAAKGE